MRSAKPDYIIFYSIHLIFIYIQLVPVPLQSGQQEIHGCCDAARQIRQWQGRLLRSGPERACVMWSSPVVSPSPIHLSPQGVQAGLHSFTCSTPPSRPLQLPLLIFLEGRTCAARNAAASRCYRCI